MVDVRELSRLSFSGHTLSVEERAGLEVAMRQRRLEEGLATVKFFGKVFGAEADYLVCYGLRADQEHPSKQFFAWCVRRVPGCAAARA
jgi:hypothetical protein